MIALLLVLVGGLIHTPPVQQMIARKVSSLLRDYTQCEVGIGRLDFNLLKKEVRLWDFEIVDSRNQRTVFIPEAYAALKSYNMQAPTLSSLVLVRPQVEIRRYEGDTMSDFKRVLRKIASRPKKDTSERKPFIMERARIEGGAFLYDALDIPGKSDGQVDFKHVRLSNVNLQASSFYTHCGKVWAKVTHLDCDESKGLRIEDFSSLVMVNKGEMRYMRAAVKTPSSTLHLNMRFNAENWTRYKNFLQNVSLDGKIEESELDLSDLTYFVRGLQGMDQKLKLSSTVKGTLSDLALDDFSLHYGDSTRIKASVHLVGLPAVKDLQLRFSIGHLESNRSDLTGLHLPEGKEIRIPEILKKWEYLKVTGSFEGKFERFDSDIAVVTNLGDLKLRSRISDTIGLMGGMSGTLSAERVAIGRLLGIPLVESLDLETGFRLSGKGYQDMEYCVEGFVRNLKISDKTLMPIHFDALVARQYAQAVLDCRDPGLDLSMSGIWDTRNVNSRTHFDLDLRRMDLSPLRFMSDTGMFAVHTKLAYRQTGNTLASAEGEMRLSDIRIERLGRLFEMDQLDLVVRKQDSSSKSVVLRSELLDMDYRGNWKAAEVRQTVENVLTTHIPYLKDYFDSDGGQEEMPSRPGNRTYGAKKSVPRKEVSPSPARLPVSQDFDLWVKLKEPDRFFPVIVPSIEMPLGMEFSARYVLSDDLLEMGLEVPYFQKGKIACIETLLKLKSVPERLSFNAQMEKMFLGDTANMQSIGISLEKKDSCTLSYALGWGRGAELTQRTNADFRGELFFYPRRVLSVKMVDYDLVVGSDRWINYPDGSILLAKDSIVFRNVGMTSLDRIGGMKLQGELSKRENSRLRVDFHDFSLDYMDFLLRKSGMQIRADINGYAEVHDFFKAFVFDADLKFDSLAINGEEYGRGLLASHFSRKDAVKVGFEVDDSEERTTLELRGTYYPLRSHKLDFSGKVDGFPAAFLRGFLKSVARDVEGTLSGDLKVGGTLENPDLFADVVSDSLSFTVSTLETRYSFDALRVKLTSREIFFPKSSFTDAVYQTKGVFSGTIKHRNFKDIRLDLNVDFDNMLAFNAKKGLQLPFWGTVFASGRLAVKGPVRDIEMTVNASIRENSDIVFDFSAPGGGSGASFIAFHEPVRSDTGNLSLEQLYIKHRANRTSRSKLSMDLNLDVTPGLSVSVGIRNTAMTGRLQATGSGLLRFNMVNGNPKLFGTYTVSGGEFDFSMVDLINKRFVLEEGGTVSWIGPMSDARVNVRADYQTKASLYPVLASLNLSEDEARQYKQNANVKSIIVLSGNLMNPDIGFDIDLTNTDEDTKDKFFAVVKKDDEDEMLRQTFSLLMFNTFMSVEGGSAGVGNSALASSSELLFSQFNNFLSKITNDFNIGVNYKPRDQTSNSEFQVMMSGQLFDDRLLINGNLGVSENTTGTNAGASTVVGDVDIEWKLTEELRLRGFNHSNDQDLTKPANSYTQGIGIMFKRDFDNLKEFLYGTDPKTREERKAERQMNRQIRRAKKAEKTQSR